MSSIIRELVTVLGFKTDLKGIKDSEKAVLSFQTQVLLGATAVSFAVAKAIDFFGQAAEASFKTMDLADATGIALVNLNAMSIAAGKFGVRVSEVEAIFSSLNNLTQSAIQGQGKLFKLAEETGIEYKDNNGYLLSNQQIFQNILKFLGQIDNKQQQIIIASRIFGTELGNRAADLARNLGAFNAETDNVVRKTSEGFKNQQKDLLDYKVAVIGLDNSWQGFVNTLGRDVYPALSLAIDTFSALIAVAGKTVRQIGRGLEQQGQILLSPEGNPYEYDEIQAMSEANDKGRYIKFSDVFPDKSQAFQSLINESNKPANNITTNVEVKIEGNPGIEQTQDIADTIAQMVNQELEYTINQIYNNNPEIQ